MDDVGGRSLRRTHFNHRLFHITPHRRYSKTTSALAAAKASTTSDPLRCDVVIHRSIRKH